MEQQPIPEIDQEAIQTAGDFYGYVIPDEDLKRRRPVQDFKAGAEWQYRLLAPELVAMKKTLESLEESQHDTAVFKEWWERAETDITKLTNELLRVKGLAVEIVKASQVLRENPNCAYILKLAEDQLK